MLVVKESTELIIDRRVGSPQELQHLYEGIGDAERIPEGAVGW